MSDTLVGVIIGAVIGIIGSLVVETFRSIRQKKSEDREYRADYLKEKKQNYHLMMELFFDIDFFIQKFFKGATPPEHLARLERIPEKIQKIRSLSLLMPLPIRVKIKDFLDVMKEYYQYRMTPEETEINVTYIRKEISSLMLEDIEKLENKIYKLPQKGNN
jgi:hypothetical protein